MARVTLQTIADALGVSRTTVSNAFSRPDQLTDQLRGRILAYAAEVGYSGPDPVARTLRRGRVNSIGLLFTESLPYAFADPYAVGFLRGLAEAMEAEGISLLLVPSPPGHSAQDAVADAVVDGFCIYSMPEGHPAVDVARRRNGPIVFVDEPDDPGGSFVGIDDRAAAAGAARHLLDLGHRRIAVLSMRLVDDHRDGPVDAARLAAATYRTSRERLRGYLDALGDVDGVPVVEASRNDRGLAARLAGDLLDTEARPTAVLAMSDQLALGVLDAARDRGLDVPGDLSVVGFDDVPRAAEVGLTTVRQPILDKGREAGALLLAAGRRRRRVLLPTELVVRRSTAPVRRAGRRRAR